MLVGGITDGLGWTLENWPLCYGWRDYVRAHRSQLRVFFLPKRAPEYNPDEQVWNEVKNNLSLIHI